MKTRYIITFVILMVSLCACEEPPPPISPLKAPKEVTQPYIWPNAKENTQLSVNPNITNYYVIMDGSPSMSSSAGKDTKIDAAKKAIKKFATLLPTDINLGLYVFDANSRSERVPLQPKNQITFDEAVDQISAGGYGTPLGMSVKAAYDSICNQGAKQQGLGEYHLVIVTDGEVNDCKPEQLARIAKDIVSISPIKIDVVGFYVDPQNPHSLDIQGVTNYTTASSPEQLQKSLQAILSE